MTPDPTAVVVPVEFASADLTTWDGFPWPEWVPDRIREEIQRFWSVANGRNPGQWIADGQECHIDAPPFGEIASLAVLGKDDLYATGRFVHAWNNIGRLVLSDGLYEYCSCHRPTEQSHVLSIEESTERVRRKKPGGFDRFVHEVISYD